MSRPGPVLNSRARLDGYRRVTEGFMHMRDMGQTSPLLVERRNSTLEPALIAVSGEVDADNCVQMRQQVTALFEPSDSGQIALDLSRLTHLGSAGIRELLTCQETAEHRGLHLTIARAHPHVRQVLTICALTELFELPST